MKLVIVESPAKARTLGKFLGSRFRVRASMGHVRDLPISELGVDIRRRFMPRYVIIRGKTRTVKELQQAAAAADEVLLATDPDREGEAISWHLSELLSIPDATPCRIEFHEVTRRAVEAAISHPRPIDRRLVEAQQARRILDRIVGYRLSPLLWKKVRRGLSAGRVQSVALRLIAEREDEIDSFESREYWTIDVTLRPAASVDGESESTFVARLATVDGERAEIPDEKTARATAAELETLSFRVEDVTTSHRQRHAPAPFTTSTLQQEAARRLGYTARRTMQIAQQLYEGLDAGEEGTVGLITYMRTDSVHVAPEAQAECRRYVAERFGAGSVPEKPNVYRSRKGAQEAHEAIRPTAVGRTPESLKPHLRSDVWRLYDLIWRRFVASQMAPAQIRTVSVRITGGRFELRVSGSTVESPGFLQVWGTAAPGGSKRREGEGDATGHDAGEPSEPSEGAAPEAAAGQSLPALERGQALSQLGVKPEQHFTEPPPRYNDASLVKTMEELGIGRPSTYAPTIETLLDRRYCEREGPRLKPTPLGRAVVRLLRDQFPDVMDVAFTAHLESQLDAIESGDAAWQDVVEQFYGPFEDRVEQAMQTLDRVSVQDEPSGETCERCGRPMVIKWGRFGRFLACSGYPECTNRRPLVTKVDAFCPRCGGQIVERRTRRGRVFYGCSNYPKCDYTTWHRPVGRACPKCGRPLVVRRSRGRQQVVCSGLFEKGQDGSGPPCDHQEKEESA